MDRGVILISVMVALILGMNAYVTYRVYRSAYYDPGQKYAQYALVWLLPVVGAILCYLFARESVRPHGGKNAEALAYDEAAYLDDIVERDHHNGSSYGDANDI